MDSGLRTRRERRSVYGLTATPRLGVSAIEFVVAAAVIALTTVSVAASATAPPSVAVAVGATPMSVLASGEAVWVANKDDGTVSRIDANSDHVIATIKIGGEPWGLASDGSSVWVGNYGEGTITRVDTATNKIAARIHVGREPIALDYRNGSLWAADYAASRLFRFDASTGKVTRRYRLRGSHLDVLARTSGIWVVSEDGIVRVDPRSGHIKTRIRGGSDTTFLTPCAGSLWASNFMGTKLWRINERTAKITGRPRVGTGGAGIGCFDRSLWLASYNRNSVLQIDPSGAIVGRFQTGNSPTDVATSADSVWVANSGSNSVTRFRLR